MQNCLGAFYPERPDIFAELQKLAAELGGHLEKPRITWRYAWMKPILGYKAAKSAQLTIPRQKASLIRRWDKAMFELENRMSAVKQAPSASRVTQNE